MGSTLSQPNLTKKSESNQNEDIKYCSLQMQGWEKNMQNYLLCKLNIDNNSKKGNSLFAIFDGYRGYEISSFVRQAFVSVLVNSELYLQSDYENALKQAFKKVDELICSEKGQKRLQQIRAQNHGENLYSRQKISDNIGCSAGVILITKKKIYSVFIGDISAYIIKDKKPLSIIQNQNLQDINQRTRIQTAGGQISKGRINGNSNLSRSFGLFSYKQNQNLKWDQQMITCLPQINVTQRSVSDNFIFMFCKGVGQRYEGKQTQLIINKILRTQSFEKENYKECLQNLYGELVASSLQNNSQYGYKNMSSILIKFNEI